MSLDPWKNRVNFHSLVNMPVGDAIGGAGGMPHRCGPNPHRAHRTLLVGWDVDEI